MIISFYADLLLYLLLLISLSVVSYGFYIYIFLPSYKVFSDLQSPPPVEGSQTEVIFDKEKRKSVSIGCITSQISLRLKGIEDPHIIIEFEKERDLEEYKIFLKPYGNVFYKPPHMSRIEILKSTEIIESKELIGHPAYIRVVALMQKERPLHFVEIELSQKYFINNYGEERMKFFLKINKIYPGVDLQSRNKQGIYSFGRPKMEESEEKE